MEEEDGEGISTECVIQAHDNQLRRYIQSKSKSNLLIN